MRGITLISLLSLLAFALAAKDDYNVYTTNAGAPIDNGRESLTVGPSGPILLQDAVLIERLAVHNRERIPERNVHARGATAKGVFKVTKDWTNTTVAKFLNAVGKETPLALRFSTVIFGKDSPEFIRDPRGFALKFYTEEGNYDIVGLNFPVFFIRDGIRFPEMIRALKPNPVTGIQEWWRIWDYFSYVPESTHMFSWLLDDVGIPFSYRHLDGWGVHTYKWLNAKGAQKYVRYYFQTEQGIKNLMDDEATQMSFSFATKDLFDSIAQGNFPKWKVFVQILDVKDDYPEFDFDPLDTTKQWPFNKIPPQEVGEITLNENVKNQFLENEQIAFAPAHVVPGIEPSNEKMLQARLFAYPDTQRYRLGVNYQLLPINAPRCPYHDSHIDGSMNFLQKDNEVNYFPSRFNDLQEAPAYPHDPEVDQGKKQRSVITKTNDFAQAGNNYRSWDADRQDRFARRVASTLTAERVTTDLQNIWLGYWGQADANLAAKIKQYIAQINDSQKNTLSFVHSDILRFRKECLRATGGF